jgi:manganese/iron transport system ATP-binding protein/manganese/zinc/iron transport system ATP- binding protein
MTTECLRETYGAELVVLDGAEQAVTVAHHEHEH